MKISEDEQSCVLDDMTYNATPTVTNTCKGCDLWFQCNVGAEKRFFHSCYTPYRKDRRSIIWKEDKTLKTKPLFVENESFWSWA